MPSAINWFQIPASDAARAKTFSETICGVSLRKMESPPGMEMWAFPTDRGSGEVGGHLVCGDGAVPSATGTIVFLNADPDLQAVLDHVEGAGGKILVPKTATTENAGFFALIADTEGNTVGLQSQG
jgi:predicted enzyme related to lactoylglutathione lyase